ncbi:MAG: late competence development ComFB family protein [Leptolyngbyaceae cyanobacterium]
MNRQQPLMPATAYINVMELLVAEEVDRQLAQYPTRLVKYLKRDEAVTFALNRLPALYASSQQGIQYQRTKAHRQLQPKITQAVRQGLAAIQGDPLRTAKPLQIISPTYEADAALAMLRQWMQTPTLTWDKALQKLAELKQQQAIAPATSRQNVTPDGHYSRHASDLNSTALRPGIYGCRTTWIPKHHRS